MQREAKAYLWDIANAAASIRVFTAGKDLNDYLKDEMLRAAVERKFGIVGKALTQLLRSFPQYRDRIRSSVTSWPFATRLFTGTQLCGTTLFGR